MNKIGNEQKVILLRENAALGDARVQCLPAVRYWCGFGLAQNLELAASWMQSAAGQGLGLAQRDLAGFYLNGIGVHRAPGNRTGTLSIGNPAG